MTNEKIRNQNKKSADDVSPKFFPFQSILKQIFAQKNISSKSQATEIYVLSAEY